MPRFVLCHRRRRRVASAAGVGVGRRGALETRSVGLLLPASDRVFCCRRRWRATLCFGDALGPHPCGPRARCARCSTSMVPAPRATLRIATSPAPAASLGDGTRAQRSESLRHPHAPPRIVEGWFGTVRPEVGAMTRARGASRRAAEPGWRERRAREQEGRMEAARRASPPRPCRRDRLGPASRNRLRATAATAR